MLRVFKFFASLQLAVGTLAALMIVLAAGTIIESRYSAEAAQILVYNTPWFGFILIILVLNLACSAADRMPWQKKHIGFVLTHLGIITILVGSFLTQQFAIDGQMSIQEGSSEKWVTLKQPVLYLYSQAFKDERAVSFKERAFRWQGREKIAELHSGKNKAEIFMKSFFPKARVTPQWASSAEGPMAVKVTLQSSFMNVSQWLADEPASREIQMGPAVLKFANGFLGPVSKNKDKPYLEIQRGDEKIQLPVPEKNVLPYEKKFGKNLKVKILEVYDYAFVKENKLIEGQAGAQAENPAAILEIEASGKTEKHTVFSNFPDFPTVHGKPQSQLGVVITYRRPHTGSKGESHELRFVNQPDGLYYQIQDGLDFKKSKVEEGRDVATGWMDFKFHVDKILVHAAPDFEVQPMSDDSKNETAISAAEVEVLTDNSTQKFWLIEGVHKSALVAGGVFEMMFGRKQIQPGFELFLKDFKIKHDPGTKKAAAFESDVILKDFTRGTKIEKTVSMNQPLEHNGFKIYQAGYNSNLGPTESSVFAVGRDPGVLIKYSGAIIMVSGILLMFYTRAYSLRNEKGLK